MGDPSTDSWIASLRAGRVNRTPSPASAAELPMSGGSGRTLHESSASAERHSSSEKTSPASSATPIAVLRQTTGETAWTTTQTDLWGGWDAFCGIWPEWGLCVHGEVFALAKWEPPMGAGVVSSWPTTTNRDCSSSGRHSTTTGVSHPGTTLNDAVQMWPTTRAEDSESTGSHHGYIDTLTSAVDLWRTPNSSDDIRGVHPNPDAKAGQHSLNTQVEMWATPDACAGGAESAQRKKQLGRMESGGSDLMAQSEIWQTPGTDSFRSRGGDRIEEMGLDQQARFWPTPTPWQQGETPESFNRRREELREKGYNGNGMGMPLDQMASTWPTTSAGDWKSGQSIGEYGNARPLNEVTLEWNPSLPAPPMRDGLTFYSRVRILLPLCRQLRMRLPSPYRKARSIFRRKLNPDFADWLMGWLPGWSSVDRAFSAAEMASYLSRQRQYLRFLLADF